MPPPTPLAPGTITERDRLTVLCAQRAAQRDEVGKTDARWKARDRALDRALAALWALGPIDA